MKTREGRKQAVIDWGQENSKYGMIHATANGIRNAALRKMAEDYRSHGDLCAKWYTVVAPVNDCALLTMHEAIEKIKESPKWKKRGIRSACEECLRMEDRYTKRLMRALEYNDGLNIDRRQFLMTTWTPGRMPGPTTRSSSGCVSRSICLRSVILGT